jgi:basic membrane protein A
LTKKLFPRLFFILSSILVLAACHTATPVEADCASTDFFCVGLVAGVNQSTDQSLNHEAWNGVLMAQAEQLVDKVSYVETIDAKDYEQNIASLAQEGYDIILTIGGQYASATANAARKFPNISFIGVDQPQDDVLPNLSGLVFHPDQAGFLAGALAAQLSKSGTIASVVGVDEMPNTNALLAGYEAGARYINPGIEILTTFYPETADLEQSNPRWGSSTAANALHDGADVIFGTGGRAGDGALIETANQSGAYCIGKDIDRWEILPNAHSCLVSSVVKMVSQGVYDEIKLAREGSLPSGNYFGNTGLAAFHDFDTLVSQEIKDEMNRIIAGLEAGSITTGYSAGK